MSLPDLVLKEKAISLRKLGLSYGEIRTRIGVSKSTLSGWLKYIPLDEANRKRLYTKRIEILSRGPSSQRERRLREIEILQGAAYKEIDLPLSEQTYMLLGAALYWAEGRKAGTGFEIANSDPDLILFMVRWIKRVFGINPNELRVWLNIYPQQDEGAIKKFWSELTGIPVTNFGKSYIKPPSSNYKKNNLYYGTVKLVVPKGTDYKHRVFGWLKAGLHKVGSDSYLMRKKWDYLANVQRPVNLKSEKVKRGGR